MAWLIDLKRTLTEFDPRIWPMMIAFVVGFLYWLFRTLFPATFDKIPSRFKAIPGAVAAAIISGLSGPDLRQFIIETVLGALSAGGGHEFIQRLLKGSKAERALAKQEADDLARKKAFEDEDFEP